MQRLLHWTFWLVFWGNSFIGWLDTLALAEMGDSMLAEPALTAEPAPSSAAATPTPAAAEPGVPLAPPTSTAAATSPGAANVDLLGGQWASREFLMRDSGKLITQYDNTDECMLKHIDI